MSGIGSVGSTPNLFAYLQSASAESVVESQELGAEPPRGEGMTARIDQALAAAGVDEETAAALKADLTAAFEESRASGSTPPDPEAMKSKVDAIFEEYGLDASEILGPPPGRGMHGAGAIPGISKAITEAFGQASFSRGFGVNTVISLPFIVFAIVGSAGVYTATGSYRPAIVAMAGYFVVALVLALFAGRSRNRTPISRA